MLSIVQQFFGRLRDQLRAFALAGGAETLIATMTGTLMALTRRELSKPPIPAGAVGH